MRIDGSPSGGQSTKPVFQAGDLVIVPPSGAAPIRRGDWVMVRTVAGDLMAKYAARSVIWWIELRSHDPTNRGQNSDVATAVWIRRRVRLSWQEEVHDKK